MFYFLGKNINMVFILALRSITSWQQFEAAFMTQFGDDKTSGTLFIELSRMKMNNKEKVKDFNQIFTILLNKIPDKRVEVVQIEFYTTALLPPISMFVKREKKQTLDENLEEVIKVEKDLVTISNHS